MTQTGVPPHVGVAYSAPPSGNVKVEMLRLFKYQATNLNRPRVAPNSPSAARGPLHNSGLFVGLDVFGIAKVLSKRMDKHVGAHEVTHALYDLRDQGLVKFHPTKSKQLIRQLTSSGANMGTPIGAVPVRIQLTQQGLERADYSEALPHVSKAVVDHDVPLPDPVAPEPVQEEEPTVSTATYVPQPLIGGKRVNLVAYPEIWRLAHSEQNMRQAVASLRAAGQDALAQMAEDAIGERSPLEQEVIQLAHALLAGKWVVDEGGDA